MEIINAALFYMLITALALMGFSVIAINVETLVNKYRNSRRGGPNG